MRFIFQEVSLEQVSKEVGQAEKEIHGQFTVIEYALLVRKMLLGYHAAECSYWRKA